MKNSRLLLALAIGLVSLLPGSPVSARPELCEAAAATAAREVGVPRDVLMAIALTETGRRTNGVLRPWPWAANTEGRGHWFDDRAAVLAFVTETLARGQRSIDIGCFQINWRWHGAQFTTPEALLDPVTAARYAAQYLTDLHREFGTWEGAAGAYHSRTPSLAARYRARFSDIRANLRANPPPPPDPSRVARTQRSATTRPYPLLSGTASGASLFPATSTGAAPLIVLHP